MEQKSIDRYDPDIFVSDFKCHNCGVEYKNSVCVVADIIRSILDYDKRDKNDNPVWFLEGRPTRAIQCINCVKNKFFYLDENIHVVFNIGKDGKLYKLMREKEGEING